MSSKFCEIHKQAKVQKALVPDFKKLLPGVAMSPAEGIWICAKCEAEEKGKLDK